MIVADLATENINCEWKIWLCNKKIVFYIHNCIGIKPGLIFNDNFMNTIKVHIFAKELSSNMFMLCLKTE